MLDQLKERLPRSLKRDVKRFWQNTWQTAAYRLTRKPPPAERVQHVVFICKGNICRSAFAEYYFRLRGPSEKTRVESSGLDVDQGVFSPPEAVQTSRLFGVDLSRHRSKGLGECDLEGADLIIPMEYPQLRRLVAMYPQYSKKAVLLRDFAPFPANVFCNIHDPFGQGLDEFQRCFALMRQCLDGLARRAG